MSIVNKRHCYLRNSILSYIPDSPFYTKIVKLKVHLHILRVFWTRLTTDESRTFRLCFRSDMKVRSYNVIYLKVYFVFEKYEVIRVLDLVSRLS